MKTTTESTRASRTTPERTCIGCRTSADRGALVRLRADAEGRVALDPRARGGGRGAWVHPTRACIAAAVKRHAAERGLKITVQRDLDARALLAGLRAALARKAASLVAVASRTRALAAGADAVAEALEGGPVPFVVVARDAGTVARALAATAGAGGPRVVRFGTRMELGSMLGRGEVAILAVLDERIAAELAETIDRHAGLED